MKLIRFVSFVALFSFVFAFILSIHPADPFTSTFSIVAVDLENGDVGVAVQSKFPNVRPVVAWAEAGVGAVATQSFSNVSFGSRGLTMMRNGATASEALKILIETDSGRQTRQVGVVDIRGNSASWTGTECFDWAGGLTGDASGGKGMMIAGKGFAAQGNILVGKETVEALAKTFQSTKGSLADKLVAALVAAGKAGGDRRGEESAALLVKRKGAGYDGTTDDYIDISIYDHAKPLEELQRLYKLHKLYFFRSEEKNLIPIDANLCKELQTILADKDYKKMEFYSGPVNGVFNASTLKSLNDFLGWENYDVRIRQDDKIDREVLEDIRKNYAEWKARRK
jgi:uncharacterized Ntn-hydrolase superfamily protein